MKKELFKKLEIAGVFFVWAAASLLHFLFSWTKGNVCGIMFGAVNESVWEHIKIFAMPYVVWAVLELAAAMPYFKAFVISKVAGLYAFSAGIIGIYYLYSGILGRNYFVADIAIGFSCAALGFFISYKITLWENRKIAGFFPLSLFLLLLYFAMYFSFTAAPPANIDLFKDPTTGTYGIPYFNTYDFRAVFSQIISV